ncbi:hypothetical protein HAX54_028417, partial [Datura stramonium]|nr:hypothetical protein [Datura stramonium]
RRRRKPTRITQEWKAKPNECGNTIENSTDIRIALVDNQSEIQPYNNTSLSNDWKTSTSKTKGKGIYAEELTRQTSADVVTRNSYLPLQIGNHVGNQAFTTDKGGGTQPPNP